MILVMVSLHRRIGTPHYRKVIIAIGRHVRALCGGNLSHTGGGDHRELSVGAMGYWHRPSALHIGVVALARPVAHGRHRNITGLRPYILDRLDPGRRTGSILSRHDRALGTAGTAPTYRFSSQGPRCCGTRVQLDRLFVQCSPRARIAWAGRWIG
jgi:hypothetical protein